MFNIKVKIFLPLLIIVAASSAYFYYVWLPKSIEFSADESVELLHHTLEIVEDEITPDLVNKNLEAVRQHLDLILLKNPSWEQLILKDKNGSVIYPEGDVNEMHKDESAKIVSLDMKAFGDKIGNLTLQYNFSESEKLIRQHAKSLFVLIILTMTVFMAIAAMMIQYFVIAPAILLTRAAEKFTSDEDVDNALRLPEISDDEMGALTSSFSVMRDSIIQQRKGLQQQNKELSEAKLNADRANHAKSEFLANMSHELRTPLNSIMGLSRMFVEDVMMSEDNKKMAGTVQKAAGSLLDIVNDILDISKIEAGSMVLETIGFDVKGTIATVMETMAPLASAKGVALSYQYVNDDIPYIVGDPLRLARILTNLVSNAVKYTNSGAVKISMGSRQLSKSKDEIECLKYNENGAVDVLVSSSPINNNKVELHCIVKDTGIGIPNEKIRMIFEKFTQADESTTRKFGGTGLGLAITKDLVEMMGGTIGVESEVGKGSSFWFKIPFEVAETIDTEMRIDRRRNPREDAMERQIDRVPVDKACVLVAEDHLLNQDFIKRLLGRMGIKNFYLVEDGVSAVKSFESGKYDLILMDCHMPEKNGYEATIEIRKIEHKQGGHIPIIALTADAMTGTREKCLKAGMDDYVTKPINSTEFKEVLEKFIDFAIENDSAIKSFETLPSGVVPVDLTLLREYAESDDEIKKFVNVFCQQSEGSIQILSGQCTSGENHKWVEAAHKLKGGAGMIGAKKLQSLCAEAQSLADVTDDQRKAALENILSEYSKVKEYLRSI